MSFLRHREIYPSDGGKTLTGRAPAHRLDEFPTGYSWAGCSPAEPASASPASLILLRLQSFVYDVSANGNLSPILVSHHRGAAQLVSPFCYFLLRRVAPASSAMPFCEQSYKGLGPFSSASFTTLPLTVSCFSSCWANVLRAARWSFSSA